MPFVKPTSWPEESDSHPGRVVVVGASTGGPLALHWILRNMPRQLPVPVVVVQHMPSGYDHHLRRRLDAAGPLEVIVPKEPVPLRSGCVYVAPSGRHSVLRRRKSSFLLDFEPGSGLSEYIPSIDVLFRSAAALAGEQAIGILLTGMGSDGVHGLGAIQKAGGLTVAQDESTSTIFGMPREAAATGAAVMILPIEKIAELIVASTNRIWAPSPS